MDSRPAEHFGTNDGQSPTPSPNIGTSRVRYLEKRRTSTCQFADRIAQLSIQHYRQHVPASNEPTCLATIVAFRQKASHRASVESTRRDKASQVSEEKIKSTVEDELFVVSMGVGTKFLSQETLHLERQTVTGVEETQSLKAAPTVYGERVRDCHAEVLACRAFRRYLLLEILQDLQSPRSSTAEKGAYMSLLLERVSKTDSTETATSPPSYRLRPNITLHFYCSSSPCGNSVIKKFATLSKEKYREDLKSHEWPSEGHEFMLGHSQPLGQFALLVKKDSATTKQKALSGDDIQHDSPASLKSSTPLAKRVRAATDHRSSMESSPLRQRLRKKESQWIAHRTDDWCPPGTTTVWTNQGSIHTCSDKLCRWNCLGLQGSLLASLLEEPLYMSTLTVGRKLSSVTCRRAVCCRIGRDETYTTLCNKNDAAKERARQGVLSEEKAQAHAVKSCFRSPFRLNHPSIMGTSVYMDDNSVIDMSKPNSEIGQDVRFHSTSCYAWWMGAHDVECISGDTGFCEAKDKDGNHSQTPTSIDVRNDRKEARQSKLCTLELAGLFIKVQAALNNVQNPTATYSEQADCRSTSVAPTSLESLLALKQQHSPDYEQMKVKLLTDHPVLKFWKQRKWS